MAADAAEKGHLPQAEFGLSACRRSDYLVTARDVHRLPVCSFILKPSHTHSFVMKSTIKLLVSLIALGLAATPALIRAADENAPAPEGASPKKTPGEKGGEKGEGKGGRRGGGGMMNAKMLTERLSLTAEQEKKVDAIIKSHEADMKAAREGGDREKGREVMKTQGDEIRAVLTPEQQKQFDEMSASMRGGKGGDSKGRPEGKRPEGAHGEKGEKN
jgi:Spy/CpxP family protein refolding chaperone